MNVASKTTTTTITTTNQHRQKVREEAKPRKSVAPKERRGEGRVGSRRVGPPLPGFRVWVCRVWYSGLNVGFWVFGLFGFRKFGQNTKTLKLAKVGLAKVGHDHCFCLFPFVPARTVNIVFSYLLSGMMAFSRFVSSCFFGVAHDYVNDYTWEFAKVASCLLHRVRAHLSDIFRKSFWTMWFCGPLNCATRKGLRAAFEK